MFGVKPRNEFENHMIDLIMDVLREGGLIPRKDDPTRQALDFEPTEHTHKVFAVLHNNCLMLGQGSVPTPVAMDMIKRYLSGKMDLMGRLVDRGVAGLLEAVDAQIKYHLNPDMNAQMGVHAMLNQRSCNVAVDGMASMVSGVFASLIQQSAERPKRETLLKIEEAIKDLFERNEVKMSAQDINQWGVVAVGAGYDTPLEAVVKIATMYYASTGMILTVAPNEGNTVDYAASVIWDLEFGAMAAGMPIRAGLEMFRKIGEEILKNTKVLNESVSKIWIKDEYLIWGNTQLAVNIVTALLANNGVRAAHVREKAVKEVNDMRLEVIESMAAPDFAEHFTKLAEARLSESMVRCSEPTIQVIGDAEVRYVVGDFAEPKSDLIKELLENTHAESGLYTADTPIKPERVMAKKYSVDEYRFNRVDDEYVIVKEYGVSPNGNPFQGAWVCRNYHTGAYVDHDRYRADLSERIYVTLNGE